MGLITAAVVFLYVEYKRQTTGNTDIDYEHEYRDDKDIDTKITPISLKKGKVFFNPNTEEERIENKIEEVDMLLECIPDDNIEIQEVEEVADSPLDKVFKDYTVRLIGSGKTNQKYKGYHIQAQKKENLAPTVHIVLTPDTFLKEAILKRKGEVLESEVGGVSCYVFYDHMQRSEQKSGTKTDRYVYEAVFSYEQMQYYIKMDFSGFDYQLKMVETTEIETSEEVAGFLQQLISIIADN